jgi:ferredoxin
MEFPAEVSSLDYLLVFMLLLNPDLCGECGGCVAVCPFGALELFPNGLKMKQDICTSCENCMIFCPVGALTIETIHPKTPFYSQARISDPDNER